MNVLHVVGGSGDQRLGGEGSEVRNSELVDPLIHSLSDTGNATGSGRAGNKADDDLDSRHQNRADDHIQAIPPNFRHTVFPTGLHSTGKQADVAYDLHHEENLAQCQQYDCDDRDPVLCLHVFEE